MKVGKSTRNGISHRLAQDYIDRELSGEVLTAEEVQALRLHLRDCAKCRQLYERYVRAEQLLAHPSVRIPTAAQLSRIEGRLFATHRRPARHRGAVFGGLATVAALAMVLIVPPESFQSRGGAEPSATGTSVRLLRVTASATGDPELSELSSEASIDRTTRLLVLAACPYAECRVGVEVRTADGRVHPFIAPQPVDPDDGHFKLERPRTIPAGWPAGRAELRAVFRWSQNQRAVRRLSFVLER